MPKPIGNQVVVITGASTGIGRATSKHLARLGARVILAARADPFLINLEQQIIKQGGRALAVPTDVADFTQVQRLVDTTLRHFGRIDVWVNNAAQTLFGTVEHTDVDEFRHLIEVNYLGQVHGTKAVLPVMRRQGRGIIIHVSSIEAYRSLPLQAAYAATKAAVVQFAAAARQELQDSNIKVCTVLPASVDTPFYDHARSKEGVKPRPVPPYYDPYDVARAIELCIRRPRGEVIAGGAGRLLLLFGGLTPDLTDATIGRVARRLQLTDIPEASRGHDNFARPMLVPHPLVGGLRARYPLASATTLSRIGLALAITALIGGLALGFSKREAPRENG